MATGSARGGPCRGGAVAIVLAVITIGASVGAWAGASNTQFVTRQGDAARSGIAPGGPTPPLTRQWTTDFGGAASTPVLVDNRVFVVSGVDDGESATLWALDASTGESLWGPIDLGGSPERNSDFPQGEVTYWNGLVITSWARNFLRTYDAATGHLVWKRRLPKRHGMVDLLLHDDLLFMSTAGEVSRNFLALDPSDGSTVWRSYSSGGSLSAANGRLYGVGGGAEIRVTDAQTGEVLMEHYHYIEGGISAPAVISGNRLFATYWGTTRDEVYDLDSLSVIDTYRTDSMPIVEGSRVYVRNGSELQSFDLTDVHGPERPEWSFEGDGELTGDPLMIGNNIYTASQSGKVFAALKTTGAQSGSGVLGSPPAPFGMAAAEGRLVVPTMTGLAAFTSTGAAAEPPLQPQPAPTPTLSTGTTSGNAVAYQISKGHTGLQLTEAPKPPLSHAWSRTLGERMSYPLIVGDRVFVSAGDLGSFGGDLYALDRRDGSTLWGPVHIPDELPPITPSLGYAKGRLFATNHSGLVHALDARTGRVLWKHNLYGYDAPAWNFRRAPAVSNGVVVVVGSGVGGWSFGLEASTGKLLWIRQTTAGYYSAPIAEGGRAYYAATCTESSAELTKGKRIWVNGRGCSGGGGLSPVLEGGRLHVRDEGYGGNLILSAADGKVKNSYSGWSPPVVHGNVGLMIVGPFLQARHLATNTILWRLEVDDELALGPVVGANVAYVAATDGTVYGVHVLTGKQIWKEESGAVIRPEDVLIGMSIGSNTLLVPTNGTLVAFR
ncbi:MAG: PQQ-binding-like beta-propeller repeat protein [Actinomycetota bacterium]|nr:PQQ-binding-like beta-propeller repeat protein [Actinomycetota bacterium]